MQLVEADDPSRVDDCARIVASLPLYQSYGVTESSARSALESALADPRAILLVALDDGETAGFAWFVHRGAFDRSGYLKQIAVGRPGHGVGAALLHELERRFLEDGGIALMVTTTNTGARRFYERRGYRHIGDVQRYVHPDHDEAVYYRPPG